MEATRLIAVRHGETAWNADGRIQGQLDIVLNDRGLRQARQTGAALADEPVDAVYASDLQRAWQTAAAIAQAQAAPLAVRPEPGLRERAFGQFEGRTFAEVEAAQPELARRWRQRDPDFSPPQGGESLLALRDRVTATVAGLAARHIGQLIVLVAHGGVLDAIYRAATGQTPEAPRTWHLGNAAINRLLWTPQGLSLVGWGDDAHLQAALDDQSVR